MTDLLQGCIHGKPSISVYGREEGVGVRGVVELSLVYGIIVMLPLSRLCYVLRAVQLPIVYAAQQRCKGAKIHNRYAYVGRYLRILESEFVAVFWVRLCCTCRCSCASIHAARHALLA